jgi:hypothetical protein
MSSSTGTLTPQPALPAVTVVRPAPARVPPTQSSAAAPNPAGISLGLTTPADTVVAHPRAKQCLSERQMIQVGLALSCFTTVVTLVAIIPSFQGEKLSEEQTLLAKWSALKDYRDACQALLVSERT